MLSIFFQKVWKNIFGSKKFFHQMYLHLIYVLGCGKCKYTDKYIWWKNICGLQKHFSIRRGKTFLEYLWWKNTFSSFYRTLLGGKLLGRIFFWRLFLLYYTILFGIRFELIVAFKGEASHADLSILTWTSLVINQLLLNRTPMKKYSMGTCLGPRFETKAERRTLLFKKTGQWDRLGGQGRD